MKELPIPRRCWVSKFMSGHFAHGKNMQRWNFHSQALCPRCPDPVEDKPHLLQCPNLEAQELWHQSLDKLKSWLKAQGTELTVAAQLLQGLQCWYADQEIPERSSFAAAQQALGTDSWVDGWLHVEWRMAQAKYWEGIRTRKSSKRWTAELIKKLWLIAWDQWEHRNGSLHNTEENRLQIVEMDVNEQIRKVYQDGPLALLRAAIPLVLRPVEAQLAMTLQAKQQWLAPIEAARIRKKEHDYGCYIAEQRFMEQWVVRPRPPDNTQT